MKRKFLHVAFGQFVEEQLLCAHVHVKKCVKLYTWEWRLTSR